MLTDQDRTIIQQVIVNDEKWEFTNDQNDPGGATMAGVTQRRWNAYCEKINKNFTQPITVATLAPNEIYEFYDHEFLEPYGVYNLPIHMRAAYFSCLINCEHEGVKILQRAIGVKDDGDFGLKTIARLEAVEKNAKYGQVNNAFVDMWIKHYIDLVQANSKAWHDYAMCLVTNSFKGEKQPQQPHTLRSEYLEGWYNRANKYRIYA